jgi:AcrR family transcriptional regulator
MRRAPKLDLAPLLGALADPSADETTNRILDAAADVLVTGGLRRCTVEEIAERGQIGRTTIYRRFDGRDEIVHAALARELRRLFDAVATSVAHLDRLEDQVVEGFLAALTTARGSTIVPLLRTEPDLLMFLVSDAGPALELVTGLMVAQLLATSPIAPAIDPEAARHGAEVVFRLAVSFLLMPDSTLPLDDPAAARRTLHGLFDPLLDQLTAPADRRSTHEPLLEASPRGATR